MAPRYVPDRPLPASAFVPGRAAPPTRIPAGPDPHASHGGSDLYNSGDFWEACEAGEDSLALERDPSVRSLLQGLILAAAACLKLRMQQAAASLASRRSR